MLTVVVFIRQNQNWRADWTEEEFGCFVEQVTRLRFVNGKLNAFWKQSQRMTFGASTGMWVNCQLLQKCFWMNRVAGVRMQISCWTGGWDGGGLEWRRDQIIRIERALWICQFHQLERGGRDEPPVRHWQRWSGESSENLVNQSRLFVDKWRKQVTRCVLLIWRQRAIVWDSDEQAALQVFHFRSNWIREVTWISADVFAACSDDGTIRIYQLGQSAPKSFNHQVNEWIFRPNQCITLVT